MNVNLHTHTERCGHASGSEREMIECAISRGIKTLGFSEHAPVLFPGDYYSKKIRMRPEEMDGYVETLSALREEYRGQIDILIGLEVEYYPELFDRNIDFYSRYPLDFLLLGQHYIGNEYDAPQHVMLGFDRVEELRQYADQIIAGLETGRFTYCAHPDSLKYLGDPEDYLHEMERVCLTAKRLGIPLEMNLYGVIKGGHYPNELFWRMAAELGNEVILGLDAHRPAMILDEESLRKLEAVAERCGIKPIGMPEIRKPF